MMTPFMVKAGNLYFNTLTGAFAVGDKKLEQYGFLTDMNPDDLMSAHPVTLLRGDLSQINTVTIFTTTDCNAKCSYCYEHGLRRRNMSEKVAVDAAEWIAKRTDDVFLRIFGGEPLVNRSAIDTICRVLKEKNVRYKMGITTNGYLLKDIPVLWHLKRAQITLDGTSDVYFKEKGLRLEPVIKNIRNAIDDGIKVVVRLNVPDDESDMLNLCDNLKSIRGIRVYAHELFVENPNYRGVNAVNQKLSDLGIHVESGLPKRKRWFCMADHGFAVCINPEGLLTLCEHYCDEEIIGSIYADDYNWDVINSWREFIPQDEECRSCFYRPLCQKLRKCAGVKDPCTEEYRIFKYREIQRSMREVHRRDILKRLCADKKEGR